MDLFHIIKQYLKRYRLVQEIYIAYLTHVKDMGINRRELDKNILMRKWRGLNTARQRHPRIVVSLTTFPARVYEVKYTIYSLFNQDCAPDVVVLWLAKEQFPNGKEDLPAELLMFEEAGLRIEWCHDCRSYKKIIPALKRYPEDIIVTVDDDIFYSPECIENLYDCHLRYPFDVIANRVRYVEIDNFGAVMPYETWGFTKPNTASYRNFFTGAGAVLYPSRCLYADVVREDIFKMVTPLADDMWLWAMAVLNERKIRVPETANCSLRYVSLENELLGINTLASVNVKRGENDKQLKKLLAMYPDVVEKIQQ